VVRIVAPELTAGAPEKYVAKFYDPFSDLRAEPCHHPEGPVQARTERREREIRAYQALQPIQGVVVPRYYGEYKYRKVESPSSNGDEYRVLMFEYVCRPPLSELYGEMYFTRKVLTENQKTSLKDQLVSALNSIHDLGVFQFDIVATNFLWNETDGAMMIDFESAHCKDKLTPELARQAQSSDMGQLIDLMSAFGIEDDTVYPPLPAWAIR
jgi:serine/threonine protein kinase